MQANRNYTYKKMAYRFLVLQASLVLIMIILALAMHAHTRIILSLFCGGVICLMTNLLFINTIFKRHGALQARRVLTDFYRGEFLKLVTAFIALVIAIKTLPIVVPVMIAAFIATQQAHWLAPLFFKINKRSAV